MLREFKGSGNKGYLRIVLGVGFLMVMAVGMLFNVWGYTSAEIENDAGLTIVDSKNALIAVDVVPSLNVFQGSSNICGSITNNKSEDIEITVTDGFDVENTILASGESTDLIIIIPDAGEPGSPEPGGPYNYDGTVAAEWPGGEVYIEFDIGIFVEENEE